jgi:hypothetical protein
MAIGTVRARELAGREKAPERNRLKREDSGKAPWRPTRLNDSRPAKAPSEHLEPAKVKLKPAAAVSSATAPAHIRQLGQVLRAGGHFGIGDLTRFGEFLSQAKDKAQAKAFRTEFVAAVKGLLPSDDAARRYAAWLKREVRVTPLEAQDAFYAVMEGRKPGSKRQRLPEANQANLPPLKILSSTEAVRKADAKIAALRTQLEDAESREDADVLARAGLGEAGGQSTAAYEVASRRANTQSEDASRIRAALQRALLERKALREP